MSEKNIYFNKKYSEMKREILLWKKKYKEERLVNKELGRRLRELRERHNQTCKALEELKNATLSSTTETILEEPFRLDPLETPSPFARKKEEKNKLLEYLFVSSNNSENTFIYPEDYLLPENVKEFFKFDTKEPFDYYPFVFMLSGFEDETKISPISVLSRSYRLDQVSSFDNCLFCCCLCVKRDNIQKLFCLATKHPFFDFHFSFLEYLQNGAFNSNCQSLKEIFKEYERLPFPRPGDAIRFRSCHWIRLENSTKEDFLSDYGLGVVLTSLRMDLVLFILGCLLLETKVIVVCSDLNRLTRTILGLVPLLRPFRWAQPLIPYVPSKMHTVCESPIPLFCGVQHLPNIFQKLTCDTAINGQIDAEPQDEFHNQEAVILSLDTSNLYFTPSLVDRYHTLKMPDLDVLHHRLQSIDLREEGSYEYVSQSIRAHIEKLVEMTREAELERIAIPDADNTNSDLLNIPFLRQLQSTQMFQQLCYSRKTHG